MKESRQTIIETIDRIEREAYERGCRDTLKKFEAFITGHGLVPSPTTIAGLVVKDPGVSATPAQTKPAGRPPEGSGEASVLADIEANPASRGHEIAERLNGKVPERTVRTALFRLRNKGLIKRIEKSWHPVMEEGVFS